MNDYRLTYHRFSECSILVQWPREIDKNILDDVLLFKNYILNYNIKEVLQVNNAYNSILIIYNDTIDNINDRILTLKSLYFSRISINKLALRHWEIPVCYDDEFGIDLDDMSKKNHLSKSKIIKIHSETIYTVFFIGFLPGFLYLGGLDKRLYFPRKKSPRLQVEKGAVAIGNEQTGMYPNSSPAGWNIIGNSPINFFSIESDIPCFAKSGDTIQCSPVSIETYNNILKAVQNGTYKIKSKIING